MQTQREALAEPLGGNFCRAQASVDDEISRLREMLASIEELVFLLDGDGRFEAFFQPQAEDSLYVGVDAFVGRHFSECLPTDVAVSLARALHELLKTGRRQSIEYSLNLGGQQRWFAANITARADQLHHHGGCAIVARDVTDKRAYEDQLVSLNVELEERVEERTRELRKRLENLQESERALAASEERYRAYIQGAPDGVFVIDAHGRIVDANAVACSMSGHERSDLLQMGFIDLLDPAHRKRVAARLGYIPQLGHFSAETLLLRQDGEALPVSLSVAWLKHGLSIGFCRDLTELKNQERERHRLEAVVQHQQKLDSLGLLASGIAHDFNNLLVGILGRAELLSSSELRSAEERRCLAEIHSASAMARDLCQQMLMFVGSDGAKVELVSLTELVRDARALLEAATGRRVTLRFGLAEDLPHCQCNPAQIRQVLLNLVTNAVEAMRGQHGTVAVKTFTVDAWAGSDPARGKAAQVHAMPTGQVICMEVSDTGPGIAPELVDRLCEPFASSKGEGRGLGMSIVQTIVRGHRGDLQVHSAPGTGTTFRVLLPAAVGRAPAKEGTLHSERTAVRAEGSVLIIDDEEIVRSAATAMLKRLGYGVVVGEDGRHGIEMFQQHRKEISCVLLDVSMPGMGGPEVYRELRALDGELPILLASGYGPEDLKRQCSDLGVVEVIQKPFTMQGLTSALARVMG